MRKNCCSAYHRSFIVGTMYVCIRNRHPENFRLFSAFSWTQGCSSTRHHQGYSWKMDFSYKMGEIQFWSNHAQCLPLIVSLPSVSIVGMLNLFDREFDYLTEASESSQVTLFQSWSRIPGLWIQLTFFRSTVSDWPWFIRAMQLPKIEDVLRSLLNLQITNILSKWNVYC